MEGKGTGRGKEKGRGRGTRRGGGSLYSRTNTRKKKHWKNLQLQKIDISPWDLYMSILVVIFLVYRRNRNGKDLDSRDRDIEYNKELNSFFFLQE